jgi:hypothetical protein
MLFHWEDLEMAMMLDTAGFQSIETDGGGD